MTVWFDDVTMQGARRWQGRRAGLRLDRETRRALLERAVHLEARDESLVRLALGRGHSYRALARMCESSAGTTYRRVRSLLRRLGDSLVVALIESPTGLEPLYREIGIRHFLRRQPAREIARALGLNKWEVYRANAYVRGWCKARQQGRGAAAREGTGE